MPFKLGGSTKRADEHEHADEDYQADNGPVAGPLAMEQPLWPRTMPEPNEIDRIFAQVFALVGEGIAGATHALLAGDRDAAKELVQRDEVIDKLIGQISTTVQRQLVHGETSVSERREYVAILRMLPDMERNGDLAEHGPVAVALAMVARFYERFGDHAVNLARRMATLVVGGPEPVSAGPD